MASPVPGYPRGDGRRTLGVLFHPPRFPVIVFGPGRVDTAGSVAGLARVLATLAPSPSGREVKIVDPTGEEFRLNAEHSALAPGFAIRRGTKEQLIDAYNARPEGRALPCRTTSLSSRTAGDVVREICELVSRASRKH